MHNNWGTTYTGTVTVSKPIPTVAELTEADYLALLDAVQLNDLTEGNLYLKSVQANLTDLLEEIHTKYGADVPTSIRNHKNYINYAAPTTYENWDYGTSTRTIVNQDGLELLQLTADSAGEISIITRSFERTSNNTKFLINIYNNQSYDVRVDIHNGYAAWAAGGANPLKANSWTTITLEKSSFAAADEVAFIFMGNEVGSTYLVSPVYDYAFDSELTGDVLYNDTITIRENGWNAATKAATKFGETYKADIADSSVEDPEWKCSLLYLSNTTTVDATKYSYVKFYLYNATDLTLFLSLKNIPSQYNFDESGNTVPMNEWKEFLIPVETWNAQNSNHLELIFGSNQVAHHGTIYVSQFVGVAK